MKVLLASLVFLTSSLMGGALPGSEDVTLTGSFAAPFAVPSLSHADLATKTIYGEWPGGTVAGGRAASGIFVTPASLEFEVAGYPKQAGIRIFLEDAADPNQAIELATARDSGAAWMTRRWPLPRHWQHRRVRLVAQDQKATSTDHWVGFTLPREASLFNGQSFAFAACLLAMLLAEWALFILPGLAGAVWFFEGRAKSSSLLISVVLAGSGLAGLICFFVYLLGPTAGKCFSLAALVGSGIIVAFFYKRVITLMRGAVVAILALWLLSAVTYTSAGLLYRNTDGPGEQIQDRFFLNQLPPDNLLPYILGESIYNSAPFRPVFFGDIQSSDRPPLQTGLTLLHRVLWSTPDLQYYLLGVVLQTSWIPALWVFLRRARVGGPAMLAAIAVPALSHFAFVHDVFVWPKLLSAAFGLLALSCFGWFAERRSTRAEAILGGVLTALAMLSHGGILMTVLGFAALGLLFRVASIGWFARFAAALVLVYLPWVLYQKFYDPPGDALLKLHLAGVINRNHSLSSLIASSYTHLGIAGWFGTKWANIKVLFWGTAGSKLFQGLASTTLGLSQLSFFNLFPTIGFAIAGLCFRFQPRNPNRKIADRMLLVALFSLAVWLLIMFEPLSTTIHQGSFATVILIFAAPTLLLAGFSNKAAAALVILQLLQFLFFVIFAKPIMDSQPMLIRDTFPDMGMFTLFSGALTCIIISVCSKWRRPCDSGSLLDTEN